MKLSGIFVGLLASALGFAPAHSGEVYSGVLEGVVKDAEGKPVAGAFVNWRNS